MFRSKTEGGERAEKGGGSLKREGDGGNGVVGLGESGCRRTLAGLGGSLERGWLAGGGRVRGRQGVLKKCPVVRGENKAQ